MESVFKGKKNFLQDCIFIILELAERIYIIEMKLDSSEKALEQIKSRKYAEKYMNSGKKIILLGIGYLEKEISWIREEI